MNWLRVAALLWVVAMPAVAAANEEVAAAVKALESGDYLEAHSLVQPLSDQGNADAQLLLGIMTFRGLGVPRDEGKAFQLYLSAAEQGQAAAMHNLATMYFRGEGVKINFSKARDWNRKAAESGLLVAQHDYASLLESGIGGEADIQQAMFWYQKAANAGYVNAAYRLGLLLENGRHSNPRLSLKYLCGAARAGHEKARSKLGTRLTLCQATHR